jgi:hypothetical protein
MTAGNDSLTIAYDMSSRRLGLAWPARWLDKQLVPEPVNLYGAPLRGY